MDSGSTNAGAERRRRARTRERKGKEEENTVQLTMLKYRDIQEFLLV